MAVVIRMPKMSDTMTEGVIAAWNKKVGDTVKSGDVLAEVETDKATMELESYNDGTLLYIGIEKGQAVPVDGLIAIIGKAGEDFKSLLNGSAASAPAAPVAAPVAAPAAAQLAAAPATVSAPVAAASSANIKAKVVRMPKMSDTMTEGTLAAWHKKVGDKVKSGDVLAEVETDKATMELESYDDGTLLYIGIEAGNSVPVDGIIAIIGEAGADYQALLAGGGAPVSAPSVPAPEAPPASAPASVSPSASTPVSAASATDERVKASPLAKKLAEAKGVDIHAIAGTGEGGRVVRRDVEGFVPSAQPAQQTNSSASTALTPAPVALGTESYEDVPLSQMRKTIARRLAESMYSAPHFYLTMEIDMTKAVAARASINEFTGGKVSFNDFVVRATAAALKQHPKVNSSWLGDRIRYNHHVHIGVAVAVDEGLLVPVVRFADQKSLSQISAEVKDLASKAKNKQLKPADWEGNTFSISNLGMFGIEQFTAIINPPDSCILAVGGIKESPVIRNGEVKVASLMKVTLSCDHRVVDGATGAAFLQTLKGLLEDPVRILA
jgi:pyruvate dehydrogenase E2 component (dihydrolipoamide acetyltransferase)